MENKNRLCKALQKIKKRYSSIFFSKLVLYNQYVQQETGYVRHYDIECQAAENIADILHTKVKAIQFRCLYQLKNFALEKKTMSRSLANRPMKSEKSQQFDSYSRTSRNAFSSVNIRNFPTNFSHRESQLRPITNRKQEMRSEFSDINYSMQALMSKVRNLNQKFGKHMHSQYPQTQYQLNQSKLQKRRMILSKLNKLENDISYFLQEQNANKYETHSNVSRGQKPRQSYIGHQRTGKQHSNTTYFSRDQIYNKKW